MKIYVSVESMYRFRGYKCSWNSCCMHACNIKFAVINVHGSRLIRENHEHKLEIYPLYTVSALYFRLL